MDLASIIGLILGAVLTVFGILSSGAALGDYWDLPSALITFGGAFSCVLVSHTMQDFINGIKSIKLAFKVPVVNTSEMIQNIIDLSNVARKEGLLSLEEAAADLDEPFLKKGILLVVDGTDPDLVRAIMETELISVEDRHKTVIGFWDMVASMGPAWGMIGTLIGLVAMLNDMNDPSSIGPAMAVALITTLYGSLLANWLATPIANKLRVNNAAEMQQKEVMIEGLLSIQAGENPRVIEEKLKSFLAPKDRTSAEGGDNLGGDE
ncbi:MAG: motility protein A [Lachnospiraceae bacterium]|nr:motility protein A [Lachnospiraceae bacterium]